MPAVAIIVIMNKLAKCNTLFNIYAYLIHFAITPSKKQF